MKIALIQNTCTKDREANLQRGIASAKEAIQNGAEVICFAELAFDPFYPQHPDPADLQSLAEPIPGPTTQLFSELAAQHQVVFVLNLFEKDGELTYDSSPVINTGGSLLGTTRMIHIAEFECFHEQQYYAPGNTGAPVYDTPFGRIGVAICYDRHYPEYMRALALNGAEVVFVPQAGALGEWEDGVYEAELQAAAFQNGYYTALCNRVGKEDRLTFAGESFVCNPTGKILARAESDKDDILYCDLALSEISSSPAKKWFLRDRRPELYGRWLNS